MLRFLILTSLCLIVAFSSIGLLISKAWGWNEYASPELYAVYTVLTQQPPYPFFLVNADSSGERWKLAMSAGTITSLACSPNGNIVAFIIDKVDLYILNHAGIVYNIVFDQDYGIENTANNGTVSLFDETGNTFIVNATKSYTLTSPYDSLYFPAQITSSGASLWTTYPGGVMLMSPSGAILLTMLKENTPLFWLASEQMFVAFHTTDQANSGYAGVIDPQKQISVWLRNENAFGDILSPDATQQASVLPVDMSKKPDDYELFIVDPFSGDRRRQLTYNSNDLGNALPLCFLTFRPQMLLADNS